MKLYKYLSACLCLFLASSCSDSFLDNQPVMSEVELDYYKTDSQIYNALVAAYDPLAWQAGAPLSNMVPLGEIRSDNARTGGGGPNDQPYMQELEEFTNTNVSSIVEAAWKKNYTGIYRCNLVINAEYSSEVAKKYVAEAKVLRAWYHFDLLRTFGPCYISLESNYPKEFEFKRNTREEVNKQIEKDLLEAIPLLEESFKSELKGRITKSTAQAILGKAYLYWADWNHDDKNLFDKAAEQFKAVLDCGQYQLFDDYSKLFASHQENNSESIFEIQRSTFTGYIGDKVDYSEGNAWVKFAGPRKLSSHPEVYDGYGFLLPTQELFDYFLPDDTIRRDATVWTHDDLINLSDGTTIKWDLECYNQEDWEGYAQKKYTIWKDYQITGNVLRNLPGNERIIRYGEVYLLLAECYLRGTGKYGSDAEAKQLIDELRKHHVAKGSSNFDGVDNLIAKYPQRFKETLDVLWYERRCELAGEGDRWFDLVRTGRAKEIMSKMYPDAWDDFDIYLPIGSIEVSNSGGTLTPYPEEELKPF